MIDTELLLKLSEFKSEEDLLGLHILDEDFNPETSSVRGDLFKIVKNTSETLMSKISDIENDLEDINLIRVSSSIKWLQMTAKLDDILSMVEGRCYNQIDELHEWGNSWKALCLELINGDKDMTLDSLLSTEALEKLNLDDL